MKVHNKNLIIIMVISIFVLVTTSLVNINLSAKKIKENEIKKLNSEMLIYKKQVYEFYKLLNTYSTFLEKNYSSDDFQSFTKIVQNLVLSEKYIKSGEIYNLKSKKLTFVGDPTDYLNSDWINQMQQDKKEKILMFNDKFYYINTLKNKNKVFAYIAFEIDKDEFTQVFFSNNAYFILDKNDSFIKNDLFINKSLIEKVKDLSKTSKTIYEFSEKNTYVYYTYIEELEWTIGLKGEYSSSKERFLLIKNFSFSSILMIIIFGLLGLKSNKENITNPILYLTNFLKNENNKNFFEVIELKEESEINELLLAFNNYMSDYNGRLNEIKKNYAEIFQKNLNIIKDFQNFFAKNNPNMKKNNINFIKNIKKAKEIKVKLLLKTDKSLKHLIKDFQLITDKIINTEKKINELNLNVANVSKLSKEIELCLNEFEKDLINKKDFLKAVKNRNKKINTNCNLLNSDLLKIYKSFDNISEISSKIKINQEKIEIIILMLMEEIDTEIKDLNLELMTEDNSENYENIKNNIFSEINKKSGNLNILKNNLICFMEKLDNI